MDSRQAYERRESVQLVDVREPDEWEAGHIAEALNRAGYRTQTLEGGMKAWAAAGLPMTTGSRLPARVA